MLQKIRKFLGIQPIYIKLSVMIYFSESSAVEIENLHRRLSQLGRNWNKTELDALKRRYRK